MFLLTPLLRAFFKWFYQRGAWSYDLIAAVVSLGRWQTWVRSILPRVHGRYVLEVGYGPGHLLAALQTPGRLVVGLDASPQMAHLAGRRLHRHAGHRGENRQHGEAPPDNTPTTPGILIGYTQHSPFPAGAFDQVIATFPTEHIFTLEALRELYRILRPGGELLLLPMAWITARSPWARAAAALFRITGQSAPGNTNWQALFAPRFAAAGFALQCEMLTLPGSSLLVLSARKES
ncbi:MAG: class I SAM-dependent methyltransferase [Anaerolineales bacterium]